MTLASELRTPECVWCDNPRLPARYWCEECSTMSFKEMYYILGLKRLLGPAVPFIPGTDYEAYHMGVCDREGRRYDE